MKRRPKGFPASVELMGKRYTIEYVDSVPTDTPGEVLLGTVETSEQKVWLRRAQCPESMKDTLVHELAHAVWEYTCSDLDSIDGLPDQFEERMVLYATQVVLQVVRGLGLEFFEE